MLSVSDARARILEIFVSVETANLSIAHLAGRVLASDITAKTDYPLFDNSSVDGFALQISDIAGAGHASPRTLMVTADIRAGTSSDIPIHSGQCAAS